MDWWLIALIAGSGLLALFGGFLGIRRATRGMRERIGYIKNARYILAGAPALIAYIYAAELYVKNVRIILASKEAGESADIIRERLRGTYV